MYRLSTALLIAASALAQQPASKFPYPERLSYRIEWHLIAAGTATVELSRGTPDDWQINLDLESAGTVAKLYRVLDKYHVITDDRFCPDSSELDAQQGKRHKVSQLSFNNSEHRVRLTEHDLVKNSTETKEIPIAPCTHDIIGALTTLRTMKIEPGQWATIPVTNGSKMVFGKIHAQDTETLNIGGKTYHTLRCEAFLFNGVLYRRKGRLLIWLTDDADRLPVQLRLQLGFPIGTISVELEKREKL